MVRSGILVFILGMIMVHSHYTTAQAVSPYSRFGLGYLHPVIPSATRGMGGISTGYSSTFIINQCNPASYADLGITTFEVGANADAVSIKTKDSTYDALNGSVSHVQLGIPLIRGKLGMSFGLLPYSNLNYDFELRQVDTAKIYRGNGSLYHFYIGSGYRYREFSFGFNVGYLFGKQEYYKGFQFSDSLNALNVDNVSSFKVGGFIYNLGLMYKKRLIKKTNQNNQKTDINLTLGVQGTSNVSLNTRLNSQWERYISSADGIQKTIVDTPLIISERRGKMVLPYNFSVGATVGNENWWLVGIDFKYAGWSTYRSDLGNSNLGDSWRLAIGGGIVPNFESRKFFSLIQYKAGAYYGQSEIRYGGSSLAEYGGTLGLSVPIRFGALYREGARFHFAADLGARNPADKISISESYYRFNFGFTLNNIWFVKRKFD